MYKKHQSIKISIFVVLGLISLGLLAGHTALAGTATLNWNANTESDLTGYKIYYGTSPRTGTDPKICGMCGYSTSVSVGNVLTYIFNNLTDGLTYYFSVSAYDTSNNESSFSGEVSKVIPASDTTAPSIPTSLSATAVSSSQINLSWTASTDAVGVTGYRIYRAGIQIATSTTTNYSNTGLSPSTSYSYAVAAYDAAGNVSAQSSSASATTQAADTASSTIVTLNPTADTHINVNTSVNATSTTLNTYTWPSNQIANAILMKFNLSSIPASSTIQSANLYLNLVGTDSLDTATSTYAVSLHKIINKNPNISLATGYTYDGVNNWTANTCCYNNIPLAQADIGSALDMKNIDKTLGYKSWNMTSLIQDWMNNPSTNYGLLLNSDSSKGSDRYRYFVSMENASTNARPYLTITYSLASSTTPSDTTAPVLSAGSPSGSLSSGTTQTTFSVSTNESATCRYSTASGVSYSSMTNTFSTTGSTNHSTTVTGLSNGQSYNYYIRCQDMAGNANTSDYSISFSVASPSDTVPPSIPASLTATAVSSSQINLSWTASTDNVGVAGYRIYRSGTQITTTANTSYSDIGLTPSTSYSYTVSAYDSAGNNSNQSSSASATTLAAPCSESWTCGNWSDCSNSSQARTCTDSNNCGTVNSKPSVSQSCSSVVVSSGGGGGGGGGGGSVIANPLPQTSLTPVQIRDLRVWELDGDLVSENSTTQSATLFFEAQVFDTDNNRVRLEIELRKGGEQFTGSPTFFSDYVDSGKTVSIVRGGLIDGFYRLKARTRRIALPQDTTSTVLTSDWLWFGTANNTHGFTLSSSRTSQTSTVPQSSTKPQYYFKFNLYLGLKINKDVESLQKVLNIEGVYPENIVSGNFGPLTKKATIAFQNKYSISPAAGYVGLLTRAKLNELYAGTSTITTPAATSNLTGPFAIGMRSEQVKVLQSMLAKDSVIYPEGKITGYYGKLTVEAVKRFQEKHNIEQIGLAGPKTRIKLNEIYGK